MPGKNNLYHPAHICLTIQTGEKYKRARKYSIVHQDRVHIPWKQHVSTGKEALEKFIFIKKGTPSHIASENKQNATS